MGNIVAFTGLKGTGKDTAASLLIEEQGFVKIAFADCLRVVAAEVFGLTMEEMTDRDLKEKTLDRYPHMSPRQILQKIGTECFRDNFPGVWINAWKVKWEAMGEPDVVVTDMRFPDELALMVELGAMVVKIDRAGFENDDPHPSEKFIGEMPAHIYLFNNHPDVESFKQEVREMLCGD